MDGLSNSAFYVLRLAIAQIVVAKLLYAESKYMISENVTGDSAGIICDAKGYSMAMLEDEQNEKRILEYVTAQRQRQFWLGYIYMPKERQMVGFDCMKPKHAGLSATSGDNGLCIFADVEAGQLRLRRAECEVSYPTLCRKNNDECPGARTDGNGISYCLLSFWHLRSSFNQAKNYCSKWKNYSLGKFSSSTWRHMKSQVSKECASGVTYWLGIKAVFTQSGTSRSLVLSALWCTDLTCTPVETWAPWEGGQPSLSGQKFCGKASFDSEKWKMDQCSATSSAICIAYGSAASRRPTTSMTSVRTSSKPSTNIVTPSTTAMAQATSTDRKRSTLNFKSRTSERIRLYTKSSTPTDLAARSTTESSTLHTESTADIESSTKNYDSTTMDKLRESTTSHSTRKEATTLQQSLTVTIKTFPISGKCRMPMLVASADRDGSGLTVGSAVTYTCFNNYLFPDGTKSHSVECQTSLQWSTTLPPCSPIVCSKGQDIDNKDDFLHKFHQKPETIDCTSHEPWNNQAVTQRRCVTPRSWSGGPLECKAFYCSPYPYIENTVLWQSSIKGANKSTIIVQCAEGYRFPDGRVNKTAHCVNGTWTPTTMPSCLTITCPPVPKMENAEANTTLAIYGTIVNFTCIHGFWLSRGSFSTSIKCQTNGNWSETYLNSCNAVNCLSLPESLVLTKSSKNTSVGAIVEYTCLGNTRFEDGFQKKILTCSQHGEWLFSRERAAMAKDDITNNLCLSTRCAPVPLVRHASPNTYNASIGSTVVFTCGIGFTFPNKLTTKNITCNKLKSWSHILPECKVVHCPAIHLSDGVEISNPETIYKSKTNVSCIPGYRFSDGSSRHTIECLANGRWNLSKSALTCQALHCPAVPTVVNGVMNSSDTLFGTKVEYTCLLGHRFADGSAQKLASCGTTGTWENVPGSCSVLKCAPLPVWNNLEFYSSDTTYRATVEYNCTIEHRFIDGSRGSKMATCAATGLWTPSIIECREITSPAERAQLLVAVEAEKAQNIGTMAIVLVSLAVVSIIVLDLLNLGQSLEVMQGNAVGQLPLAKFILHVKVTLQSRIGKMRKSKDYSQLLEMKSDHVQGAKRHSNDFPAHQASGLLR